MLFQIPHALLEPNQANIKEWSLFPLFLNFEEGGCDCFNRLKEHGKSDNK
jgi:hypothetical protein